MPDQAPNQPRVVLLVRDPGCIFAYWEAPAARDGSHDHLALRVHDISNQIHSVDLIGNRDWHASSNGWIVDVHDAVSWYLHLPGHGRSYGAEIGSRSADGVFRVSARSNAVTTPPGNVSDHQDENWATMAELYRLAAGLQPGTSSPDILATLEQRLLWHVSSPLAGISSADPHAPKEWKGL